jgi:Protein kinase domain
MLAPSSLPQVVADRYRPIRLIAMGGMGAVYEVEHIGTGQRLALKVLLASGAVRPEALARFQREVRASALIESEHVVRVLEADVAPELGGAPFLVMELLDGSDLERATAGAPPPPPATVVQWLRQVGRAIDEAHRLGIVHRDLKPENLFLVARGDGPPLVKVLDFGIVKLLEEGTGATVSGQILGTPKYMAPEQASTTMRVTPATDRYALGLIAYRLLTGQSYHQGSVMSVLGQLLHGQLEAPSKRGSPFGAAFDAWFLRACHRNPTQRFASASEQVEALGEALGLHLAGLDGGPAASAASSLVLSTPRQMARASLPLLVLAAVAVMAIGSWQVYRARQLAAPVCGLPSQGSTESCGSCMAQACCSEAEQCAATEGCPAVEACERGCASGDAACRATCSSGKGAAAQLQRGVQSCRAEHCVDECLPGPWECLKNVAWHFPSVPPRTIVIKSTTTCASCGLGGGPAPLAGVSVRVCSLADPGCELPLASSTSDLTGAVSASIDTALYPPPLSVYLEYRKQGYREVLVHLNTPPLSGDIDLGRMDLLDPQVNVAPADSTFGTTDDPTRAGASVLPMDCNGLPAAKKLTLTWLDRDDQTLTSAYFAYTGDASAMNLPINGAALTRLVARVTETNQLVATTHLVVRPGVDSITRLVPTP